MSKEKSILVADYKNRIIWFDGSITQKTASRFSKIVDRLNKLEVAPIVLYIRGPGGDPWSAFSMINDVFNSPSPIGCVAHGCVASGCFTLTQAGLWRAALPGTRFVFHSAEGMFRAHKKDIQMTQQELSDWAERLKLADFVQFFWFSMRGRPVWIIEEMLKSSKVLSLPQAKKLRLVDSYFKNTDFLQDEKKIREIIRKQRKF
ncbi:MAG: ATP-dependent Clp protease proteolytic subunit [bacterium]|nr:ATP-dependent Clp protease proteolytic subunit [bacterium]